ncbi:MAG: hypothetical protein JEZ07_05805 [Phycisphaerae bacterium]|nr:hypothetical protein [Phycisphaerae bacterium]
MDNKPTSRRQIIKTIARFGSIAAIAGGLTCLIIKGQVKIDQSGPCASPCGNCPNRKTCTKQ